MTRSSFVQLSGISLDKLLLDTKNPRIRAGANQADCIERLLRKPSQLLALARDIAANGLSTAPILVEPVKGKKYKVWDGNRRVTALKLLNDPSLCPKRALQTQFAGIASRAKVAIPASVDVLASSDEEALLKEVLSRHAGGLDGAGQLNWDALLRTMFLLGHKASAEYRLSGLLLMWAEEHGIEVDDSFPITTIHRFLNRSNLARLGFVVEEDELKTTLDKDVAVRLAERLVADFSPGGPVGVTDVFSQGQQDTYIDRILTELGLLKPQGGAGAQGDGDGTKGGGTGSDGSGTQDGTDGAKGGRGARSGGATRPKAPRKPDWDRKSVVRSRFKPEFPDDMWKADEVLRELRRLDTENYPISAAALFRMFFELSTRFYMKRFKTVQTNEMHKNALAVAKHMREHGRIDQGELDAASRRLKDKSQAEALLQYATLNDYMHSFKNIPDRQSLHVLWTELEAYLEACWDHSRRPE